MTAPSVTDLLFPDSPSAPDAPEQTACGTGPDTAELILADEPSWTAPGPFEVRRIFISTEDGWAELTTDIVGVEPGEYTYEIDRDGTMRIYAN